VVSYWGKFSIDPTPLTSVTQLWERTSVGPVPGQLVLALGPIFYLGFLVLGFATLHGQRSLEAPTR
jgi:hypothetical protein